MPISFAGKTGSFSECVTHYVGKGKSKESAGSICGSLEKKQNKQIFSYHFTNGIKFKEENGEFYSEGYIATSHKDKYGDVIPKSTLSKIAEKIKNNDIGRNLFYPSYVSIRHDWIDLDAGEFKDLPIAGKATNAELRQLPDGEWGVYVSTHHSKQHPDYEQTKYNTEHGYYPGYSIEYNTIAEHKEGDKNILDDIELLGYAFADGRFIANPHAQIENYGYKEMRKPTEENKMENENQKTKEEVNYKETLEKLQEDLKLKEAKITELEKVKVKEDEDKPEDTEEAKLKTKLKEMEIKVKEYDNLKVKEAEAVKTKENETKMTEIVNNILTKAAPGFMKFDNGTVGIPEVKEYFDVLNKERVNFNSTINEKKLNFDTAALKEVATKLVNKYPDIIHGERVSKNQIFDTKLKQTVIGYEPEIGTYDISMARIGVKALTAYNSPSNDETTYFQAPAELGDVYDPMLISQLNDDTIFLGIIPKEDYSGKQNIQFRVVTAYGTAGGYLENDTTWTATNSTRVKCEQNFAYWRETYEVTNQARIAAQAAGGIGDVTTREISDANINMLKDINSKALTGGTTYNGATASTFNMLGVEHLCGTTGNLYGKDRSSLTWLQAQTPITTAESIGFDVCRTMIENVQTTPADAKIDNLVFVTSLRQERLLKGILQKMYSGFLPQSSRVGFTSRIDMDGIPIFPDGQANTDDLFLLDLSHTRFAIQKAPTVTKMGIAADSEKGFVTIYFNLYCTKPKNNIWHSALTTS